MRFYIFKSEKTKELRAFTGDHSGAKLPKNHGPWTNTGVVGADRAPPHKLSRQAIEKAARKVLQELGKKPVLLHSGFFRFYDE